MKILDLSGVTVLWQKMKDTFVAKIDGKGLSTNDYNNAERDKLLAIPETAAENVIETITVNAVPMEVRNKTVNVAVPTDNINLLNGAGYQTATDVANALAALDYVVNTGGQLSDKSGNIYPVTNANVVVMSNGTATVEGKITSLEGSVSTLGADATALAARVTTLEAEIAELKAKVAYIGQ